MKKILLFSLMLTALVGVLVACSITLEDKVTDLITKNVKKELYHPESYEAIETVIDSAFSPIDDPKVYEYLLRIYQLGEQIESYGFNIKSAAFSMANWSDSHTEYGRVHYNQAKQELDMYKNMIDSLNLKATKIANKIKTIAKQGRQFIGFKATHKYRANNNAGQTLILNKAFIFDSTLTNILAEYDADSEEYLTVKVLLKMAKEYVEDSADE